MELTKKSIRSIRDTLAKKNSVFSNKRYLDSLFLPSSIIGRQKQAEEILKHVESVQLGFVVPLISIYGRSGSGKSTVVKFVCQNIQDTISFAFANLRKSKTIFGCANLILSELGAPSLKSSEGLNQAIDKIGERVKATLSLENKKTFLLVLDEYDVIFHDTCGKPSDFVYKLLTLEESLREKGLLLSIITISNNALGDYDLDDRVKSRMGSSEVFFPPYSEDNVKEILRDRADKAFVQKIDDEILQHCAKISSDDHGDARRAIDLLRVAGELSDGKKITKLEVDKAQEYIQKDRIGVIVSSSSYHQRVVIGSICYNTIHGENSWTATSAIYERYTKMLKDAKPLSYRRITDLLIDLENTGLVLSKTLSRGRHGYGTEYKLKFSPDIVGPLVGKEWWDGVLENKKNEEKKQEVSKLLDDLQKNSIFGRRRYRKFGL